MRLIILHISILYKLFLHLFVFQHLCPEFSIKSEERRYQDPDHNNRELDWDSDILGIVRKQADYIIEQRCEENNR
jgi:hypothetical protein